MLFVQASAAVQIQKLESRQAELEADNSKLEAKLQEETAKLEHLKTLKNKESPSHTLTEAEQGYAYFKIIDVFPI